MKLKVAITLLVALALSLTASASAAPSPTQLQRQIKALRAQVQTLRADLNEVRATLTATLACQTVVPVVPWGDPNGSFGYDWFNPDGSNFRTTALDLIDPTGLQTSQYLSFLVALPQCVTPVKVAARPHAATMAPFRYGFATQIEAWHLRAP